MENIFLKILNMSISASWLILAILLLRLIFRRLPKWIMLLLWGIVALLLYAVISYLRVWKSVKESMPFDYAEDRNAGRIRICDRISTPFILGIFRTVIYLPSGLSEEDTAHVIAHEMAHLKRGDHFWKPLGFLLLMVYWFNPLVWVA